jgi:hypothetical protein
LPYVSIFAFISLQNDPIRNLTPIQVLTHPPEASGKTGQRLRRRQFRVLKPPMI